MVRDVDLGFLAVKDFKSDLTFNISVYPDLVQVTQVTTDLFVIYESWLIRGVDLGGFAVKDFKSDLIFNIAVTPDIVQVTQVTSDLSVIYSSMHFSK